ncbi:MAG TPA: hypothetical protein VG498_15585 [Terriglobales bacterium]|nr:hypothetical protein [Terriglobales bacterium]
MSFRVVALLGLISLAPAIGFAEDLSTANGVTFHDIEILSRSSSAIGLRSKEGEFEVPFSDLKPADRVKYSKSLANSISLPAVTVLGEPKPFSTEAPPTKGEAIMEKELRRQQQEQIDAAKKRKEHPPPKPIQVARGVTVSLGSTNPRNEAAIMPSYLTTDYQSLDPKIIEKDLRGFLLPQQGK